MYADVCVDEAKGRPSRKFVRVRGEVTGFTNGSRERTRARREVGLGKGVRLSIELMSRINSQRVKEVSQAGSTAGRIAWFRVSTYP